jgi:3-dehydroquinate synthetase
VLLLGPLPKVAANPRDIVRLLRSDKKTREGVVHFVLSTKIGAVEIVKDVPDNVVLEAVKELRRISR